MAEFNNNTKLNQEQQNAVLYWPYIAHIPIVGAVTQTNANSKRGIYTKGWNKINFKKVDFEAELKRGEYDEGIALILGKTMLPINGNGKEDECYYSFALDFDGYDAVEEWFGSSWDNVLEFAKQTRIEWHQDKGRIHVIFMSKRPISNKQISIKDSKLEVRCERQPLFSSPSINHSGNPWTVLGTNEIAILNDIQLLKLEARINHLCEGYMSDDNKQKYIEWLEDPNTKIKEHEGRHPANKTIGCSYFYRYNNGWKDLRDDERKEKLEQWNQQHCEPPLPQKELDCIWKWIVDTHRKNRDRRNEELEDERRRQEEESEDLRLPSGMSESKFNSILQFNFGDRVTNFILNDTICTIISEHPPKFIVALKRRRYICRLSITYTDSNNTRIAHINLGTIIIRLFPKRVILHESPLKFLESPPQYTIVFEDQNNSKEFAVSGSIDTIVSLLKEMPGYVVSSHGVTEALTAIIGAFNDDGRLEVDKSISFEGYYHHDGDIQISKIDFDKKHPVRTIEECKQCIDYLEKRSQFQIWEYKGRQIDRRDLLASIIQWAIAAPFNFAMKQLNCCKPYLKGFNMSGERDGGKSGLSEEILNMHGNLTNEQDADSIYSVSAGSVNTEAKLGKAVSKTTYPIEFSEFGNVESIGRHEDLVEIFKTIIDGLIVRRGRDIKTGRYDAPFPSCSPLVINGNVFFSRKGELVKRYHISKFSEEDRHSRDPKSEFNVFQRQNKHLLKILGDWTMRYIYENRQELLLSKKYSPYEAGKIALEKFYEFAGNMQVPEWLTRWITDTSLEELDLDDESLIRSILYNHVHKTLRDNYSIIKTLEPDKDLENIGKVTLEQRISWCLDGDFWPWIRKVEPWERVNKNGECFYIDTSIMEIFSYRLPNLTFKKLSEKTGFECIRSKWGRTKILCSRAEFMDFITGIERNEAKK